jgi:transposase
VDIRKLLLLMRDNQSDRAVSRELKIHRDTVQRYRQWATQQDLFTDPLLSLGDLQGLREKTLPDPLPPQNHSSVEPFREIVLRLRSENVKVRALFARLKERGYGGSYASVYRFVTALEPKEPDVCVRVETAPGEEAQVDFGEVGRLLDPATAPLRRVYCFVMTLCWSRHAYVEFVFDQKVETWLGLHVRAFAFFGGVVERITCDNLKSAIIRAAWEDPVANIAYGECAEHYGFRIAPCRPQTPKHKGKVERGVGYVKGNFWAGREFADLDAANRAVREWCLGEAGQRVHGTTKERPLDRFAQSERARLLPLPRTPYDMAVMKEVKLHRDCYVVFEGSYYSAPYRLVNQKLWVRGGVAQVRLYDSSHRLLATHERAHKPGERLTHPDHLPAYKLPGLLVTREDCVEKAQAIGTAASEIVETLLADPVLDKMRTAGRLVRLVERYSLARVEAACARALHFGDPSYTTVKRILHLGLDQGHVESATPPVAPPVDFAFARSVEDLFGANLGGVTWN